MYSGIFVYLILEDVKWWPLNRCSARNTRLFVCSPRFLFFAIISVRAFSAVLDSLVVYCSFIFFLWDQFFNIPFVPCLYLVKLPIAV